VFWLRAQFSPGCASKEPKPDVELLEIVQMFPGHYDNSAQVQADIAKACSRRTKRWRSISFRSKPS